MEKALISEMIEKYGRLFPEETDAVRLFTEFLSADGVYGIADRKNPVGHLTASAIIAGPDMERLLLVKHKVLGRWLQPGGHIEADDKSVLKAALREAEEET